jgi:NADPH:quinone reductase-like Zn-dependent oxidoreductase
MRAVGVTEWGGPDVLQLVELPTPEPGPGEVRIRVRAATVNPTDTVLRSGGRAERLRDVQPPHVPGMDAAGVVEEIGEGTETELTVGEQVMAVVLPLGPHGAYAERVVVPTESVVRSPAGASGVEAATLPMNGLTARVAVDMLGLCPGQVVAVSGAAGAVGGYAMQLAKADGLHVVADAAPADEVLVRTLGADTVLPRGDCFAARVRELHPQGVDGLIDAALLGESLVHAVRSGGAMVTLRGFDGSGPADRGVRFFPIYVRNYIRERAMLHALRADAEAGVLTLRVARTFPAGEAAAAHRLLEAGGVRGRLVLTF